MHLGIVVDDSWDFINEIYADLKVHHNTTLFERRRFRSPILDERINRYLFKRDLKEFLQTNDVVFFEWASGLLAAATQLPKTCGIVARLHRYEMYRWADEINWNAVDRIIVVSDAKRLEFVARFPEQAPKLTVIPEAISLERFKPQPKLFSGEIGILCHLRPRKRVYELILAFYELSRDRDDLHLHVGGGNLSDKAEYFYAVQTLVEQLGMQNRVTFYGHVDDPQAWYQNIDVFVSNSFSEGLQVALLEAMASECYCLSHRWEGVEELLPAENLFFTERELVELILNYCDLSDEEQERERKRLREIVSRKADVDETKVRVRQVIEEVGVTV